MGVRIAIRWYRTSQAEDPKDVSARLEYYLLGGFDVSTENQAKIKPNSALISIAPFMVKHPCNLGNSAETLRKRHKMSR